MPIWRQNKKQTMKKVILSTFVLTMAVAIQAQEIPERKAQKPHMQEREKRNDQHMYIQKLNLTDDQKVKFKSQREDFRNKMEDLKKNDNITVKEYRSKMESFRKEHKNSTENILTSEQKGQLGKMKTEEKAKGEAMGKQRAEKMKVRLGLTDEQSAKMESNRKVMGGKMKALRENNSLSTEQKKESMKELMKKQKESMKPLLTEEQLKKMKEMNHKRPEDGRMKPENTQMI